MENIELRSEKVKKLVGRIPSSLVRYSTISVFMILIVLGVVLLCLPFPKTACFEASILEHTGNQFDLVLNTDSSRFVDIRLGDRVLLETKQMIQKESLSSVYASVLQIDSIDVVEYNRGTTRIKVVLAAKDALQWKEVKACAISYMVYNTTLFKYIVENS